MPVNGRLPSMAEGASALARVPGARSGWPYPWTFPPPGAQRRNPMSWVAAPANGVLTELLAFQVPDGDEFVVEGILFDYFGIPFVPPGGGGGTTLWTVDVDSPITALAAPSLPSRYVVPDFYQVQNPLGSRETGPVPVNLIFGPRKTVRVKIITTAPFPAVGSPVVFWTWLKGWTYPKES